MDLKNRINAPTLAYKCVYGRFPSTNITGMFNINHQKYKDIEIDDSLDINIIDKLNNIKNIEIRSTCSGHNKDRVTYIIFRTNNQDEDFIKRVVAKLNFDKTKCVYDIGNGGEYRICVATRNWYRIDANNNSWLNWWKLIPDKINSAVNKL